MEKTKKLNNQGYTLVEMIIVIAIIAILTGMATVTVTLIHSAKAKEAVVTVESEVSSLITTAKNQQSVIAGVAEKDYLPCIKLYKHSNGNTYLQKGYYNTNNSITDPSSFTFVTTENGNGGLGKNLSAYVYLEYTDTAGAKSEITSSNDVYIVYNKQGTCISGAGSYSFFKKNGSYIARLTLNKNGSHRSN